MPARYSKHISILQGIIDFTLITLVYLLSEIPVESMESLNLEKLFILYISFFLAVIIYRPYKNIRIYKLLKFIRYQASFISIQIFISISLVIIIQIPINNAVAFFKTYIAVLGALILYRIFYYHFFRWYRIKGYNYRNIVIVGYGKTSKELANTFRKHPEYGYKFLKYFSEDQYREDNILPIDTLFDYCLKNSVDQIYCCIPFVSNRMIKQIIEFSELHHIKANITTDFRGFSNKGFELEKIENIPVLKLAQSPLELSTNRMRKRIIDFTISLFLTVVLYFPLYMLFGILIKLESKGPVLFKQKRTGLKNSEFTCLKFRTMKVNGDSETQQAQQNDSRITKVGSFLRKTSLDEIPQFINVLKGDMSLIGPRPHMVKHTEIYSGMINKFMARHNILPGMTGLAQLKGYRGEIKSRRDIANRIKYDKFYIENWSMLMDLEIFIKTILIVIKGDENAY